MVISLNTVFSLALAYLARTFEGSMEVWLSGSQRSASSLEPEQGFHGADAVELKAKRGIWISGPWIINPFTSEAERNIKEDFTVSCFVKSKVADQW